MSYSELEDALLTAGHALSTGALGQDLRRFHPGRRGKPESFSFLAGMELNHPPAIQRTMRILYSAEMTGFDLRLTDEDQTYLAWVPKVVLLLQALVDSWWGGINPDLRVLFVDGDDAPPIVLLNTMFPGSRTRKPPSLRHSAAVLGVRDAELSALSRAARAAQRTTAFEAASDAAREVRSDPRRRRELLNERNRIEPGLAVRRGKGVADETERIRDLVKSAYLDASDWVRSTVDALRGYNELVTACLAFLLGYSEAWQPLAPILIEDEHPITVEIGAREFQVHLTFTEPQSLATDAVFAIRDGGPLDGLYLDAGAGFQTVGDRAIVDRYGLRIRELEMAS